MAQKFYVDINGNYIGSYDGPSIDNPYAGETEVLTPPVDGREVWGGTTWTLPNSIAWDDIRVQRDALLRESDWTQMPDSPLDATTKGLWTIYRQDLRDIPQTFAIPSSVVFPTKPS